jgi:hypothetical protein
LSAHGKGKARTGFAITAKVRAGKAFAAQPARVRFAVSRYSLEERRKSLSRRKIETKRKRDRYKSKHAKF